jgi:molecular chaperone GrpE (heat shock protein)
MKKWLRKLFNPEVNSAANESTPGQGLPEKMLQEMNDLQSLRMELAESKRMVVHLTQEIERVKAQQEEIIQLNLAKELEGLFKDMAAPASQSLTQAHLVENQGKKVSAQDLLTVSRRMLRAMERHGVIFENQVGETVLFDPGKHIAIQPGQSIDTGKPVIVRFCGVSYRGKMIHKAIVEQETECRDD